MAFSTALLSSSNVLVSARGRRREIRGNYGRSRKRGLTFSPITDIDLAHVAPKIALLQQNALPVDDLGLDVRMADESLKYVCAARFVSANDEDAREASQLFVAFAW